MFLSFLEKQIPVLMKNNFAILIFLAKGVSLQLVMNTDDPRFIDLFTIKIFRSTYFVGKLQLRKESSNCKTRKTVDILQK